MKQKPDTWNVKQTVCLNPGDQNEQFDKVTIGQVSAFSITEAWEIAEEVYGPDAEDLELIGG
jgi:hypothetical protein